jgi:hypothetical protein
MLARAASTLRGADGGTWAVLRAPEKGVAARIQVDRHRAVAEVELERLITHREIDFEDLHVALPRLDFDLEGQGVRLAVLSLAEF